MWNRLSDENLSHLMRNAIKGPDVNLMKLILMKFWTFLKKKIGALHCNWYIILL